MALPRTLAALAALVAVASLVTAGGVLPSLAPATPAPGGEPTDRETPQPPPDSGGAGDPVEGRGGDGETPDRPTPTPSGGGSGDTRLGVVLAAALGCVLLGGVALAVGLRGDDPVERTDDPVERTDRTADRPPPAPDNGVARAWGRMVSRLDADPRARTPAEFADRAVEAGMDPEAVRDLTALFRGVRYGGRDPTGADEARAARLQCAATARADESEDRSNAGQDADPDPPTEGR